ncbi:glycoside hydrolase family 2 TIM barrel-domain containing protein [Foetidibacter luteolus]|uniref:glycoside hydrolase family 2 TIM barrel-domain containing protein n=1 Tax=Foetidibacter luteolus TaxID=2608880 RepID=UPI00129AB924|nr:glycoside hydrolase family 2 TIM barrel-domain containing protein [Foetidibacter luteolus]
MKTLLVAVLYILCGQLAAQHSVIPVKVDSRTVLFNNGWQFVLKNDTATANVSTLPWRQVNLPHDWSIEDLPAQRADSTGGPFSKASAGGPFTGHTVGGTAWYRKTFTLPASVENKIVYLQFDGVYQQADVWFRGENLGTHPNGYTPFYYNITRLVSGKAENSVEVEVKNIGRNSRWYSGSGIYRHVWLTVVEPVHIAPMGVYITTSKAGANSAAVNIATTVSNFYKARKASLKTVLLSPTGAIAATVTTPLNIAADSTLVIKQQALINQPLLWSVDKPDLYSAKSYITDGGTILDSVTTTFGIRTIVINARQGLLLNGKRLILKGGCVHHDNGALGAAAYNRAEERKLEILKANGYNAIRTSHNPPSTAFLDACDRLGLLVINEAFDEWEHKKLFDDSSAYHHYFKEWWQKDIEAFVKRDRNHPSVALWSIGNEIYERADTPGLRITKQLTNAIRQLDSTRKITEGICWFWDHPGRPWDSLQPAFALLDVAGYNYEWQRYADDHRKHPNRIIVGTETYAQEALENYSFAEKNPHVLGDFLWTAWDYIGEAGIGHTLLQPNTLKQDKTMLQPWPWFNAWCGDIDLIGQKKPQSYYRDVVWRRSKIEMLVQRPAPAGKHYLANSWGWPEELKSWTWNGHEGKPVTVRVFSRSKLVRLELNGKPVAEKSISDTSITAVFQLPYQPGLLKAFTIENGHKTDSVTIATAGPARKIKLVADRSTIKAGGQDLSFITAEITDDAGNILPDAETELHFEADKEDVIVAVANGNPKDMSSFRQPVKKTFRGRGLVIVKSHQKAVIQIKAKATGLEDGTISITAE